MRVGVMFTLALCAAVLLLIMALAAGGCMDQFPTDYNVTLTSDGPLARTCEEGIRYVVNFENHPLASCEDTSVFNGLRCTADLMPDCPIAIIEGGEGQWCLESDSCLKVPTQ